MDIFEKVADILTRTTPAPVLAIAIAVTLILFLPIDIVETLGVVEFREQNRGSIGWALIIAYSYLGALAASALWKFVSTRIRWRINTRRHEKQLHRLTDAEKEILAEYIAGATTIYRPIDDGVIGGMQAAKIVFRSSNAFDLIDGVPYNLQPWARIYLTNNPHLLAGYLELRDET